MTEENRKMLISMLRKNIPEEKLYYLKKVLDDAPDSVVDEIMCTPLHESTHILLFSIFLGGLGVDRFMIGDTGLGVGKLLFGWLTCGVWPLIDIFMSHKKAKEKNFDKIMDILE